MYGFLYRLGTWLLSKLAVGALIVALGLLAFGAWLYVRDHFSAEVEREVRTRQLVAERDRLLQLRAEVAAAVAELQTQAAVQQERVERAERILATLRDLEGWWDRWFGDREQQARNEQRVQRVETLKSDSAALAAQLRQSVVEAERRLQGTHSELDRVERELTVLEASESQVRHYLAAAWEQTRWYLLVALLTFFFGPSLVKVLAYFVLAPLLARGRPIRFAEETEVMPAVGASRVSVEAALWPGEVLRVKEKFLQASDEGLHRRTRFVLDWRIPLTSVACGLIELVEMRHGHASGELRVTFSTMDDPHTELAVIAIPEGGSLILRPSFLAGVITAAEQPLRIRRRWALLRWQAWLTLQFRFFEFVGPCRLIVAGTRGVRGERLLEREGATRAARRTNQQATIGFTPGLDYLPVRAETFWSYYRGMNPLFDDLFAGKGLFVLQETSQLLNGNRPGRFWSSVWSGLLKIFGL
jgi:hypothetical protein